MSENETEVIFTIKKIEKKETTGSPTIEKYWVLTGLVEEEKSIVYVYDRYVFAPLIIDRTYLIKVKDFIVRSLVMILDMEKVKKHG